MLAHTRFFPLVVLSIPTHGHAEKMPVLFPLSCVAPLLSKVTLQPKTTTCDFAYNNLCGTLSGSQVGMRSRRVTSSWSI
jgi:hypothetical protein